jgi:hypothetical protein
VEIPLGFGEMVAALYGVAEPGEITTAEAVTGCVTVTLALEGLPALAERAARIRRAERPRAVGQDSPRRRPPRRARPGRPRRATVISRPAYHGAASVVRDVEPLAGLRAIRDIELGALTARWRGGTAGRSGGGAPRARG